MVSLLLLLSPKEFVQVKHCVLKFGRNEGRNLLVGVREGRLKLS